MRRFKTYGCCAHHSVWGSRLSRSEHHDGPITDVWIYGGDPLIFMFWRRPLGPMYSWRCRVAWRTAFILDCSPPHLDLARVTYKSGWRGDRPWCAHTPAALFIHFTLYIFSLFCCPCGFLELSFSVLRWIWRLGASDLSCEYCHFQTWGPSLVMPLVRSTTFLLN